MNTQLKATPAYKSTDNLIILADKNRTDWASAEMGNAEASLIQQAAQNELPFICLPSPDRLLIVHFLNNTADTSHRREEARLAGNEILSQLSHYKIKSLVVANRHPVNQIEEYLEGMLLGNYRFTKYFSKPSERESTLKEIWVEEASLSAAAIAGLEVLLKATSTARDLVNEPQSHLDAVKFSHEMERLGAEWGFEVTVLEESQIRSLKMGGLLAVNQGSEAPPTFNILEWKPEDAKNSQPVVLVGKGVVYDTGGLSLKPTQNGMDMMKFDMAGAATVIGAMIAIAGTRLPLHVIALIPATDNRPGGKAYAPGDVITMYSGATVEVLDTDAEGRLILADALHYAKKYNPELVLDCATLTGAAQRATGPYAICYMGNADRKVKDQIEYSGHQVHERLVEFPLWKEYGQLLRSNIADLKNVGGPYAGAITAGKFLEYFTTYPWLHLDIAGPAWLKTPDGYRPKEGTGVGVRLLFDFLKRYCES